jgi:Mg2+/Co2+ transporter CorC
VFGLAGKIPAEGEGVDLDGYHLTVEKLQGRRIIAVVMEKAPEPATPETSAEE